MKVSFHPDARIELREAYKWYHERSPVSATAFAHAIDTAVSRISKDPTQFPLAEHATRMHVVQRFPFNIF